MKNWLKGLGAGSQPRQYSVDELIVLERYDEARTALERKLKKRSQDIHTRTKLAEVLIKLRQVQKAVEHFSVAAEQYAADGFFDKGIALLSKAARLAPANADLPLRMDKLRRRKDLARTQFLAVAALKEADAQSGRGGTASVELERIWTQLADSDLVGALPAEQLKRLFGVVEIQRRNGNEVLAVQGQELPEIFIIASCEVEVLADRGGNKVALRSFGSGDILGEAAMFQHHPWPATYRVTKPGAILRLTRDGLEKAMMGNEDPRQLLDALRNQGHDAEVVGALSQLASA